MELTKRFVRERFIAEGGFGEVWQAYDNSTKTSVALKI